MTPTEYRRFKRRWPLTTEATIMLAFLAFIGACIGLFVYAIR